MEVLVSKSAYTSPTLISAQGSTQSFKDFIFKSISLNPGQSLGNRYQSIWRMAQGVNQSSLQGALAHPGLHQEVLQFEMMWFWSNKIFWSANKSFSGDFGIPGSTLMQQWGRWKGGSHTAEFQPISHSPKAENKHAFIASHVYEREKWNHWWVISIADIYTIKVPGKTVTRVCHVFTDWRWLCSWWCWYFSVIICPHRVVHRDRFDFIFWVRSEGLTSMSPAAWNNRHFKWKALVLY